MRLTKYKISETSLYSLELDQVTQLFIEKTPLNDNGGEPDGPSRFLESAAVLEGLYGKIGPTDFWFGKEEHGYRLTGYLPVVEWAFEQAHIHRWMGNKSQSLAFFVASEKQKDLLEDTIYDMEWDE